VNQLETKVLDIIGARCNHEVNLYIWSSILPVTETWILFPIRSEILWQCLNVFLEKERENHLD